jgi:hypothetical protein
MSLAEYIGLAFVFLACVVALAVIIKALENASYDEPKKPAQKTPRGKCWSCMHGEISTVFPEIACPIQGRHVEPHHSCDEWA